MLAFAVSISVNAFSLHFKKCRYFACELLVVLLLYRGLIVLGMNFCAQ